MKPKKLIQRRYQRLGGNLTVLRVRTRAALEADYKRAAKVRAEPMLAAIAEFRASHAAVSARIEEVLPAAPTREKGRKAASQRLGSVRRNNQLLTAARRAVKALNRTPLGKVAAKWRAFNLPAGNVARKYVRPELRQEFAEAAGQYDLACAKIYCRHGLEADAGFQSTQIDGAYRTTRRKFNGRGHAHLKLAEVPAPWRVRSAQVRQIKQFMDDEMRKRVVQLNRENERAEEPHKAALASALGGIDADTRTRRARLTARHKRERTRR